MKKVQNKKKKAQLPFRLNILFFIVFLLFAVLIIQLGIVQILNGEAFQTEIEKTTKDITKIPVPRGEIYDRNYNVIAKNKPMYAITYTPPKGVQAKDRLEVAQKLAEYIDMFKKDPEEKKKQLKKITERDKKEYWYLLNEKEALKKLPLEEAKEMDNSEQYNEILERITKEEYDQITEQDKEIILIKKELDRAYSLTPQIVKSEEVTPEEYARVAEHLAELPGINATTDWVREYPYDVTFRNIIGKITTEKAGLPAENIDYYLAKGYSRNDRVGDTGLEKEYEDFLRGRKEQVQYTMSNSGVILDSDVVVPGESGKDVILTVDMEFQDKVDEVLRQELKNAVKNGAERHLRDALAVVMNPNTGEVLAVSGQSFTDAKQNEIMDTSYKVLHEAHRPGSAVKGATILSGYESGIITPGHTEFDTPMKIAGTPTKGSWKDLGYVNDLDALRMSSNVYMFYIALKMGGEYNYQFEKKVRFNPAAFTQMRNYFKQFGLGVETGIDFPYESTGYVGPKPGAGLLMDYAIGQYDTFTAMQLAQYVSTIANGGYRVQPHFLKEVRNPSTGLEDFGTVYKTANTQILNRIVMDDKYIKRVQEGFRQVFQEPGGTAYNYFRGTNFKVAGKTGTAQNEVFNDKGELVAKTVNLTMVAYAPYDNPEIAIAVIVPNLDESSSSPINHNITRGILDAYFSLKEDRAKDDMKQDEDKQANQVDQEEQDSQNDQENE
ncbi:peptidoglycan D,D-transpeptidase FtsI family protein [Ornithinibacillus bavariensis]|uniref:serine-type D-Ala-D-Ala carboxypeptidase n=1 Tax=Ornithinibacillus bavariensis TaxID=545502 RepID=A0A919XAU1_9BACI|nr:penicillin-binding protein 2 [Ornithinibacillus bavariensis]GIO27547.1 penicillin-binding protein [Ornithinibacillus bavariensis]